MNTLRATISALTVSEHLSNISVTLGEDSLQFLLAEASSAEELLQTDVVLAFKETEVILSKVFIQTTANILQATIRHIERGIVLSQITLAYCDVIITALVATLAFDSLQLSEGDDVYWMVQPSEISLLRGHDGV